MANLILRTQTAQAKLKGDTHAEWSDNDYAVCDDRVIGRIYRIEGGPQHQLWRWDLNNVAFYSAPRREDVVLRGVAPTLDEAKAEIKAEYEKWFATPTDRVSVEVFKAYDEQREDFAAGYAMIREALEMHVALPSREATGVTPTEEAAALVEAINSLASRGRPPSQ